MRTLRVGFIGCGVIARAHALSIEGLVAAGLVQAEIVAVHDVDGARASRFAQRFGAAVASSMEEIAGASDAVYVCTSTQGHLEAVRAAAQAGRPIFCEKPLSRNLPESLSLAAIAAEAGVAVQVGLVMRTAPVFRQLADIMRTAELGRPMAAIVRDDQFFPNQGHYGSTWRSDVTIAGGGALLEHSIHDVDIIGACFGRVGSVCATVAGYSGYEGIEDSASALLQTDSGLTVSLVSVWHQVLSRPSTRRVEVLLEGGVVSLEDDFIGPLTVQTTDSTDLRPCPPPAWVLEVPLRGGERGLGVRPYIEENRDFLNAVRDGTPPVPGLAEAVVAHQVVDACYRSAADGGALVTLSP
jgi:predicted dehydrogenase